MQNFITYFFGRHKMVLAVLCLLVLSIRAQQPVSSLDVAAQPKGVDSGSVSKNNQVRSDSGRIRLIFSDYIVGRENTDFVVFVGNVCFRRDSMYMYCDSLYLYNKKNMVDAFGNVRMEQGDTLFVYGDVLYYDGDTQLARMRENVRMINREVTLYTDSLNYDQRINVGYYFDGGRIVDAQNELTSVYGQYSPDTKDAIFQKEVVLTNNRFVLHSDTLEYNTTTKIADILGPSTITSDSNIIYSDLGWYDTQKNTSTLYDRSTIVSKERVLTGDTIYYDRNNGYGEVFGNMFLNDTVRKVIMTGQYGFYNEKTEYAFTTDEAMAIEYSGVDSLFLHGDTLKSYNDTIPKSALKRDLTLKSKIIARADTAVALADSLSAAIGDSLPRAGANEAVIIETAVPVVNGDSASLALAKISVLKDSIPDSVKIEPPVSLAQKISEDTVTRLLEAYHNVRFFRNQSQGVCDSMVFVMADSVLSMYKDPILWNQSYQIVGNVIDIYLAGEAIDWVHLPETAFAIQEKEEDFYDQMKGKEMKVFFDKGEARQINVIGNVETIFYPLEKDSSILYQNKSLSSSLTLILENQRMKELKFYVKPDMVLTPSDQIKSDMLHLKGFKWFSEIRPKSKQDIFRKVSKKDEDKDTQKNRFLLDE